jgi:hypothetical protein
MDAVAAAGVEAASVVLVVVAGSVAGAVVVGASLSFRWADGR